MAEFDTILAKNSRGADITSTVLCDSIIEFQFEFDFGRRQSYIKGLFQNFHGPVLWDDAYRALRQRFLDMKDSHDPKKREEADKFKELSDEKEAMEAAMIAARKTSRKFKAADRARKEAASDHRRAQEKAQEAEQRASGAKDLGRKKAPAPAPNRPVVPPPSALISPSKADIVRSATLLKGAVHLMFTHFPGGVAYLALGEDQANEIAQAVDAGFISQQAFEKQLMDDQQSYETDGFFGDVKTVPMYASLTENLSIKPLVPFDIPGDLRKYQVFPEHVHKRIQAAKVFYSVNDDLIRMSEIRDIGVNLESADLFRDYVAEQERLKVVEKEKAKFRKQLTDCTDVPELLAAIRSGESLVGKKHMSEAEVTEMFEGQLEDFLSAGGSDGKEIIDRDHMQELLETAYGSGFVSQAFIDAHDIDEYLSQRDEFIEIGTAILNDDITKVRGFEDKHGDLDALFTEKEGIHLMPELWSMYSGKYTTYKAVQEMNDDDYRRQRRQNNQLVAREAAAKDAHAIEVAAKDALLRNAQEELQRVAREAAAKDALAIEVAAKDALLRNAQEELQRVKDALALVQAAAQAPPPPAPAPPPPAPAPPPPSAIILSTITELADQVVHDIINTHGEKDKKYAVLTAVGVVNYYLHKTLPAHFDSENDPATKSAREAFNYARYELAKLIAESVRKLPSDPVAVVAAVIVKASGMVLPTGSLQSLRLALKPASTDGVALMDDGKPTAAGRLALNLAWGLNNLGYILYKRPEKAGESLGDLPVFQAAIMQAIPALKEVYGVYTDVFYTDLLRSVIGIGSVRSGFFEVHAEQGKDLIEEIEQFFHHKSWEFSGFLFEEGARPKAKSRAGGSDVVDLTVDSPPEQAPEQAPESGRSKRRRTGK